MQNLSLRLRTFAAALLTLLIFIPLAAFTLEKAFNSSLTQSMLQQLRVQSLSLISEFEFENGKVVMPEQLYNDQFNLPDSGLYAFIQSEKGILWQSLSTLHWQTAPTLSRPNTGDELFIEHFDFNDDYFIYAYTAEFDNVDDYQAVSFTILQDKAIFNAEKQKFANTLWKWLALMAILLLLLLLISLNAALLPISKLNRQIVQAEKGQLKRIDQTYPPELETLKTSINHLLDSEEQQRSRYKNSLSDLAHSLKTPLAVLSGNSQLPHDAKEPIQQIDQQIQRQLKRAAAGASSAFESAVEIKPLVEKLLNAMAKVYLDKNITLHFEQHQHSIYLQADTTDVMEILGNLVDNACKAAKQKVLVSTFSMSNKIAISVEDDGAGIPADQRQALLKRGTRLDSYKEGQGIGMAVVSDLVAAYQGKLEIDKSELGGARITISFTVPTPINKCTRSGNVPADFATR
ncbi:ATP-binding protein [Paraglaciecola aquimarina]|uniref:histidine kinase n=1 Tax=Paraglaciecola aquimarina TaxID=1235557 RepID=A0ABU3T0X9_9ALTE|nr:ATP-binding protein [Paraglaciecola aquimarina]MDU0355877.1 ATP-binding protein [Paraglaciecola aquimarina]